MRGLFAAAREPSATSFSACIGSDIVRFHFASADLAARHEPPFGHFSANGQPADLDVFCFTHPAAVAGWLQQNHLNTTPHKTFRLPPGIQYCSQEDGLFWLNHTDKTSFFWGNSPDAFEPYRSKPFSRLLYWHFENKGFRWCHGACVATETGAALIPNVGGAGKSTTAAAALLSGMDFLGDDYLLIEPERSLVFGMYSSLMLSEESIRLLRHFERSRQLEGSFLGNKNKFCHYLYPAFETQLKAVVPLQIILVPEIADGENSRIEPASKEEAMQAFVSSVQTAWLFGGDPAKALRGFYQLTQKTPVAKLLIGRDLKQVAELIKSLLA
ncbi:MAG: hypothetical protein AAB316_07860 [Bacteroidota bacterium]